MKNYATSSALLVQVLRYHEILVLTNSGRQGRGAGLCQNEYRLPSDSFKARWVCRKQSPPSGLGPASRSGHGHILEKYLLHNIYINHIVYA